MEEQMILLSEFNANNFKTELSVIEAFNHDFPNVSVTTIPLSQMKANYYLQKNQLEKALDLVKNGYNSNPYLGFGDYLLSKIHKEKGALDSAKHYAIKAIEKLPNNGLHINNLYQNITDFELADKIFEKYKSFNEPIFWLAYINFSINNPNVPREKLIELNKYALDNFKKELDNFKKIDSFLKSGGVDTFYKQIISEALDYFRNGKNQLAIEKFKQAIELNQNDYSNYENLAIVYYNLKDFKSSLKNINIVIEKFKTTDGKAEMIKGLALIGLGDNILACEYFKSSSNKGLVQSKEFLNSYCGE